MKLPMILAWACGLFLAAGLVIDGPSPAQEVQTQTQAGIDLPIPIEQPGIEVQARGPVHEAYAQPFDLNPEPSPLAPKEPPPAVPELPPEQRPEGDNVQWIPGYWAWDADRNDYMWISGVYRNVPGGRQYVAGYWNQTNEGWRWVPGFWGNAQQSEIPYAPQPPAPLETGPNFPGPDDNSFYIPGTWMYRDTRFLWRPGYWAAHRPGRMWIPSRWTWTPAGFVFVDGYWDYPIEDRGLLFAPVCFTQPLWGQPGWAYRPSFVVGIGPFLGAFFSRPAYGHYYFGDYYGPAYARLGFNPWFAGSRYDPYWNYYRWHHRGNPGWHTGIQQTFADRGAGRAPLPPRTLAQQNLALQQRPKTGLGAGNNLQLLKPLNQAQGGNLRLTKLDAAQLAAQQSAGDKVRDLAKTRKNFEGANVAGGADQPRSGSGRSLKFSQDPQTSPRSGSGFDQGSIRKTDNLPDGIISPKVGISANKEPAKTFPPPLITTPKTTATVITAPGNTTNQGNPATPRPSTLPPASGPKTTNLPPSSGPKTTTLPPSSGPKTTTLPPASGPRTTTLPPSSSFKGSNPPPSKPAGPRFTAPSSHPKVKAPPSTPRFSSPTSPPSVPRISNPPPQPRSFSPGGGTKGGGGAGTKGGGGAGKSGGGRGKK